MSYTQYTKGYRETLAFHLKQGPVLLLVDDLIELTITNTLPLACLSLSDKLGKFVAYERDYSSYSRGRKIKDKVKLTLVSHKEFLESETFRNLPIRDRNRTLVRR